MNSTEESSRWALGVLIGGPIAVGLTLIFAVVFALSLRRWLTTSDRFYSASGPVAIVSGLLLLATVLISAVAFYPYDAQYHKWQQVDGTVAEVNKRLIGSGDGMSEKFVVRFSETNQEYGCEDTRCALVEPGDALTLSCIRKWQYSGTDGWDCAFVEVQKSAAPETGR